MEASDLHFEKTEGTIKCCPSCGSAFECNAGDIEHCVCASVSLTEKETGFVQMNYTGCLCINCLKAIKQEINPFD
ncbi:MAG: cysteine-rich CWC family protein [Chitinophagaceae bacterium]|nr:cysteine-rich CWC family protein [Chitinophagaceae bacterium]